MIARKDLEHNEVAVIKTDRLWADSDAVVVVVPAAAVVVVVPAAAVVVASVVVVALLLLSCLAMKIHSNLKVA